ADVILAVGTGFSESDCSSWNPKFTFAIPPSRLIQIDADPQEIGKIYPVEVGILGDAKTTLQALIAQVREAGKPSGPCPCRIPDLDKKKESWRAELAASQLDGGKPIHPARLLAEISKVLPDDAVVVTDVGWNKNGAGQQ